MIIRDIEPKDKNVYFKMSEEFYDSGVTLKPIPKSNFEATFNTCLEKSPYVRCLIFEQDNQVCGYSLIAFSWSNETGGKTILLDELFINKQFRNLKIGTKFLEWIEQNYLDISAIRLEVCTNNEGAIRLYQKNGFDFLDYGQMRKIIKK